MLGKLSIEEINQVLEHNVTGRIGCTDGEKVYIVPVSYAYNDTYLIAHSKEGMKIEMMREHPGICFQVDEIKDLSNWRSVICWGDYEEITNQKERYYAMKFLVSRLTHLHVSETVGMQEMHQELTNPENSDQILRPIIYRIRISERTGRYEKI
ncbi:pyridoxamine 5'-phosphate oxidase family protein [Chitinophaga silvatica]|uniref:Pyridoxamine 5'-phosphate oxidase family protein n=1 Tax=Chitinophaga silvatica TaxID=2282649 RepID=A0A3E1YGV6_9BACT|nr:pyridoxamine 5'-phosphate oxidase family protein [Chitinophaga silvatica]RFS26594.1 pyridoxamine 5'-phosphate oxidase family protein [Chitinophaga silvatica]